MLAPVLCPYTTVFCPDTTSSVGQSTLVHIQLWSKFKIKLIKFSMPECRKKTCVMQIFWTKRCAWGGWTLVRLNRVTPAYTVNSFAEVRVPAPRTAHCLNQDMTVTWITWTSTYTQPSKKTLSWVGWTCLPACHMLNSRQRWQLNFFVYFSSCQDVPILNKTGCAIRLKNKMTFFTGQVFGCRSQLYPW